MKKFLMAIARVILNYSKGFTLKICDLFLLNMEIKKVLGFQKNKNKESVH